MEEIDELYDERLKGWCVYCGQSPNTKDHVPPKVFLDKPLPKYTPVVEACLKCNHNFSKDEEYVACLIACAISGNNDLKSIARPKIRNIIAKRPAIANKIITNRSVLETRTLFETKKSIIYEIEEDRVHHVILKLARGHAAYELGSPQLDRPTHLAYMPIHLLNANICKLYNSIPQSDLWPEIGSRALQRMACGSLDMENNWIIVQKGLYKYMAFQTLDGIIIRFTINEYLACEVAWGNADLCVLKKNASHMTLFESPVTPNTNFL